MAEQRRASPRITTTFQDCTKLASHTRVPHRQDIRSSFVSGSPSRCVAVPMCWCGRHVGQDPSLYPNLCPNLGLALETPRT
ncbi:hypothetical protein O3P69_008799 [Scylla paramamosain]|uniref:Uncharacterized protein n=1 Tax=Scylla paramamosain TaxID=85552 RepID=A0AAW0TQJ6_SCYPA